MSVKNRLKLVVKHYNLTTKSFEKSINASNGYVNSISKSIGLDKLNLFIKEYPEINIIWLLTGKEEMVNDSTKIISTEDFLHFGLENNDLLLNDQDFRNYIRMNMEYILTDEERSKKKEALKKLKEIASEKFIKKN